MTDQSNTEAPQSNREVVAIRGMSEAVKGLNKTMGHAKTLVSIADAIKKQPEIQVTSQGKLVYKNHVADKIKDVAKKKLQGKITGLMKGLVFAELEKLTVNRVQETKARVIKLAAFYRRLGNEGLSTVVDVTGFTGSDYWHGHYNKAVAKTIERVIERNSGQVRKEAEAAKALAQQIATNVKIVDEMVPRLLQTAKILTQDVAFELAKWNIRGLTQDTAALVAKTAIGMLSLSSEMLKLKQYGPKASQVVRFQGLVFQACIKREQIQHKRLLKHIADYVVSKPNSVPSTAGKGGLGAYFGWWKKGGEDRARAERTAQELPSKSS